jgi:hypothetical protein
MLEHKEDGYDILQAFIIRNVESNAAIFVSLNLIILELFLCFRL